MGDINARINPCIENLDLMKQMLEIDNARRKIFEKELEAWRKENNAFMMEHEMWRIRSGPYAFFRNHGRPKSFRYEDEGLTCSILSNPQQMYSSVVFPEMGLALDPQQGCQYLAMNSGYGLGTSGKDVFIGSDGRICSSWQGRRTFNFPLKTSLVPDQYGVYGISTCSDIPDPKPRFKVSETRTNCGAGSRQNYICETDPEVLKRESSFYDVLEPKFDKPKPYFQASQIPNDLCPDCGNFISGDLSAAKVNFFAQCITMAQSIMQDEAQQQMIDIWLNYLEENKALEETPSEEEASVDTSGVQAKLDESNSQSFPWIWVFLGVGVLLVFVIAFVVIKYLRRAKKVKFV